MADKQFAIDTNILVYIIFEDCVQKRTIANTLLAKNPIISTQVVSEFLNVSRRKLKLEKIDILSKCVESLNFCKIASLDIDTLKLAKIIIEKNKLQIFDAIIVASAIQSNCSILYSEDLQHKQTFEKQLIIINPFL